MHRLRKGIRKFYCLLIREKNRTDVSLFVITDLHSSVKISCNLKKKNHTGAYFTIIRGFLEKYKYASLHFHIVKQ